MMQMAIKMIKTICNKTNKQLVGSFVMLMWVFFLAAPSFGQDMRAVSQKAKTDHEAALTEAGASEERILTDRESLEKEIARLELEVKALDNDITIIQDEFDKLKEKELELAEQKSIDEMEMRELTGTVRVVARDMETTLRQSQFTVRLPERLDLIEPILKKDRFPGMNDFKTMTDLFFQEMDLSGEVVLGTGLFVDRKGVEKKGKILTIGKFTAAYRVDDETGYLRYSEGSNHFYALSAFPSWSVLRNLNKYIEGKTDEICLDFSRGAALRQITHKTNLIDQVKNGGPLVWPILATGLFALIIAMERMIFLRRVHANTDRVMGKVNELALEGKWQECDKIAKDKKGRPAYNVLKTGLNARAEERETLESVLQEAILKELPRLERFLPTLNIMGAVAPLLGLLGTVTGMISTFHVITLYGTGDPRMMSGGISEALVTTMLGLSVAIPIMLVHTFLSRRVDHIIGDMEEKAVALTNIIYREIRLID